jgi:hypothetical protein
MDGVAAAVKAQSKLKTSLKSAATLALKTDFLDDKKVGDLYLSLGLSAALVRPRQDKL